MTNEANVTILAEDYDASPANGAAALHVYARSCPLDMTRPLVEQPLFAAMGDAAITGESLLDKICKAMLDLAVGEKYPEPAVAGPSSWEAPHAMSEVARRWTNWTIWSRNAVKPGGGQELCL